MEILKTVHTFNGDYDISKVGSQFSVQLDVDEIVFENEKQALKAIHEHSLDMLFDYMPLCTGLVDNTQLQKMIEYINEVPNRKSLFLFVTKHSSSAADFMAIKGALDDGYYEYFDRYDSSVVEQFINIYKHLREWYLYAVCNDEIEIER